LILITILQADPSSALLPSLISPPLDLASVGGRRGIVVAVAGAAAAAAAAAAAVAAAAVAAAGGA
jgi:hypothetical protein